MLEPVFVAADITDGSHQISRLKEARELERLQAVQQDMRFSAEQREAARLRAEQIALEQQQRGLEIARQTRDAGGRVPGVGAPPPSVTRPTIIPGQTAPLPIPKVEALPVLPTGFTIPTPQLTIERLIIQMDSTGQGRVITPQPGVNILSVLVQASQTVQSGG